MPAKKGPREGRSGKEEPGAPNHVWRNLEKFYLAVEQSFSVVVLADASGAIEYANPRFEEVTGYDREEVLGRPIGEVVGLPEDRRQEIWATIRTGAEWRGEVSSHGRDGREYWVLSSISPLLGEGGEPAGYLGVGLDITERKRAEAALSESERRFRSIFEESPLGMTLIAPDFTFIDVNPAFCRMLRYERGQLIGRTFVDITHREDREISRQMAERVLNREIDSYSLQKRFLRSDGSAMWARITASVVRDEAGRVTWGLGAIEDVTEARRMEEALEELREELDRRAERVVAGESRFGLTFRELTVVELIAKGHADKEIGGILGISPLTVNKHVHNVLRKMGASSRTEAVVRALQEGLLDFS